MISYTLDFTKEQGDQISQMAENEGYDCDLTYLKDHVLDMIAGKVFKIEPMDVEEYHTRHGEGCKFT